MLEIFCVNRQHENGVMEAKKNEKITIQWNYFRFAFFSVVKKETACKNKENHVYQF